MFHQKKLSSNEEFTTVKLKNFLHLSPKFYVTIIFFIVVLLAAYYLFIAPGIKNYGSWLILESYPSAVPVYVNDNMVGTTPAKLFLSSGEYRITLKKDFFKENNTNLKIKGQLFGSLFFKKKVKKQITLDPENIRSWLEKVFYDASAWMLIKEDQVYHQPPLLVDTAHDIVALWAQLSFEEKNDVTLWADSLKALIQDEKSWQQVTKAWLILSKAKLQITFPVPIVDMAMSFDKYYAKEFVKNKEAPPKVLGLQTSYVTLNQYTFLHVPSLLFTTGISSETLIANNVEEIFLNDFYYMPDLMNDKKTGQPILNLSYYEVSEFIEQFNRQLMDIKGNEYIARLPTETEWEYLAKSGYIKPKYFEWTNDDYVVYRSLFYPNQNELILPFPLYEKSIRGSSVFSGFLPIASRRGYFKEGKSPYLGFRLVLTKKA